MLKIEVWNGAVCCDYLFLRKRFKQVERSFFISELTLILDLMRFFLDITLVYKKQYNNLKSYFINMSTLFTLKTEKWKAKWNIGKYTKWKIKTISKKFQFNFIISKLKIRF